MLKLKLQYFGHLMWRTDSLEKTFMMEKIEGRRGRGQQRMRWLDGITNLMDMSLKKHSRSWRQTGSLACCSPWGCKELDMTEWLNWACFFKPGSNQSDCCPPAKDWEPMWTNLDWSVLCKEGKSCHREGMKVASQWNVDSWGFVWICQKQGQFYDYLDFLCESKRNTAGKGNVWPFLWFGNVLVFVS